VRLVDADGQQLGIRPLPEALTIAREMDLDLVEVAPLANPPVCRIMDYGKFKFDEAQRAKESRRKSTSVSLKEMKYRLKIGPGDFDTKTRKVAGFLADGHKVKITIMFRGREVERPQYGKNILDKVADQVAAVGKVEMVPRLDGRNMVMVLSPDKRAQQAAHRHTPASEGVAGNGQPAPAVGQAAPAEAQPAPAQAAPSGPASTGSRPSEAISASPNGEQTPQET
jgi:translation initiation factor IF-3